MQVDTFVIIKSAECKDDVIYKEDEIYQLSWQFYLFKTCS